MNALGRAPTRPTRLAAVVLATCGLILIGCSGGDDKQYDISPIFPLTEDKCATYNGEQEGDGFGATCMVSKADCERAVADWRETTRNLPDAIQFSCD